tara:strand:- start:422 stop:601 length:180 start_codon:yes stop_codon:yes gene_type:complete
MSSYKGLFVQKLDNSQIIDVQVEDPHGNSLTLPEDDYRSRGILPLIEDLPDSKNYSKND